MDDMQAMRDAISNADLSGVSGAARQSVAHLMESWGERTRELAFAKASGDDGREETARERLRIIADGLLDIMALLEAQERVIVADVFAQVLDIGGKIATASVRYAIDAGASALAGAALKAFAGTAR